jgi:hypothetical protein
MSKKNRIKARRRGRHRRTGNGTSNGTGNGRSATAVAAPPSAAADQPGPTLAESLLGAAVRPSNVPRPAPVLATTPTAAPSPAPVSAKSRRTRKNGRVPQGSGLVAAVTDEFAFLKHSPWQL